MTKPLTIGRLAKMAEVSVETVRYYQRFGIIDEPPKPMKGYRVYPLNTVDRIYFIKRAKQLGFSLKETAELLLLEQEQEQEHCDDVRSRAEEKRSYVEQKIKDLVRLRKTLDQLIQACKSNEDTNYCPIVNTLTGK